jgi:branched-chain amino acid transport system substrate-binding protein
MMRGRKTIAACAVGLASLGLAACGSSSGGSASGNTTAKGPFTVLAIVASSGPLAAVTQSEVQGLQAGAKYVNAHGGILGSQVEITVKNDNTDPTTAANLLQAAVSGGTKPDLVYAGTTSDEALAMMPILTQDKIFSLQTDVSDQTIDPSKHPYAFSLASSSNDFAQELAAGIKSHYPNAKKIGIIIGNDVTGSSNLKGELAAFKKLGYTTVVQQYNPTSTVNMTPQLEALKAARPDVLVASGFGAVSGYILKSRAQIGWNVPVVGDASFSANPLPSLASAAQLKGVSVLTQQSGVYKPLSQQSKAFQTLYKAVLPSSGKFEVPLDLYEFGWDDIMVAKVTATQAGSFGAAAMTSALEHLKDQSNPLFLLSKYHYSPASHSVIADLTKTTLGSPYTKGGQSLPFGQTG